MNPKTRLQAVLNHRRPRHSVIGSHRMALLRLFFAALLLALLLSPPPALAASPDDGFNPGADGYIYALAVQADGKIVVGGWFSTLNEQPRDYIGRLNPDGTLDTTFNPGADDNVYALAMQADGKIVVGGGFTTLGGKTRNYIGRLSSDTAALQNLSTDTSGTTITWMRSGASPEIWRVTFELSTNGVNYIPLGAETRSASGWQLTGLMLPRGQNLFIRARGYYATGHLNGSGSVVESVRNVYLEGAVLFLPIVVR